LIDFKLVLCNNHINISISTSPSLADSFLLMLA
jgi:hypothetical protein